MTFRDSVLHVAAAIGLVVHRSDATEPFRLGFWRFKDSRFRLRFLWRARYQYNSRTPLRWQFAEVKRVSKRAEQLRSISYRGAVTRIRRVYIGRPT